MNIDQLYEEKLKKQLQHLETKRKSILIFYIIAIVLFVGGLFSILYFMGTLSPIAIKQHAGKVILSFVVPVFLGIYIIGFGNKRIPAYKNLYKKEIVQKILTGIAPNWEYDAKAHVSEEHYIDSGLFNKSYEDFLGDDLVRGKVGQVDFESSELKTGNTQRYTDSEGDDSTKWVAVFKGYFFHAQFNKHLKGETYLVHGDLEAVAETLRPGSSHSKRKPRGRMVSLENKEFSSIFIVTSTDQIEARYILTPRIMEALVNIYQLFKQPIRLSFLGDKVYLAMLFSKDLFEPSIWKSGVNKKEIEKMAHLFLLNKIIIEELDLNTRIWTKE